MDRRLFMASMAAAPVMIAGRRVGKAAIERAEISGKSITEDRVRELLDLPKPPDGETCCLVFKGGPESPSMRWERVCVCS